MKIAALGSTPFRTTFATGAVWVAFALIGAWGHLTHWNFGRLLGSPAISLEAEETGDALVAVTPAIAHPHRIELASAETIEQMGIQLIDVVERPLRHELTVAARVSYEQTRIAQLTSRVPGTVWRVEKQVGEVIHRGEVLAIIDSMLVGKAKAELLHALANVTSKQRIYERMKSIEFGVVPLKQVEQAEVEARQARFDLFNAQQMLVNLGLPVDSELLVSANDEDLLKYVKFLGLPKSLAETLDVKTATANLLPLFAPFDGVVICQDIVNGEVVSTDRMAVEIADLSRMLIKMSVREEAAAKLKLGQPVTFVAGESEVSGAISWISTEVDIKTRTVEVRSIVDNPAVVDASGYAGSGRLLRANMFGIGKIQVEEKPQALVVPAKAVQWDGVSHVVFVRTGDAEFDMRAVDVGIETDEFIELVRGVNAGERIAVEGSHILKSEARRSGGA
jgi:cobalt-zinc-cadmium efflux system membrane fusion protein